MKVAHILFSDQGGAYRAAERISCAIKAQGVESYIMLIEKNGESDGEELLYNRYEKLVYKIRRKLHYIIGSKRDNNLLYIAKWGCDLIHNPHIRNADIINIHWIGYNVVSQKQLMKLAKKKTVIWTLHDMWPFTGGCFYSGNCLNYLDGCKDCNLARSKKENIQIAESWKFKRKLFAEKVGVVGCSSWILNEAQASLGLDDRYARVIHNPIDTSLFCYTLSDFRERYGINVNTKIIAFGADRGNKNARKGMKQLIEAINKLETKDICCVIFGNDDAGIPELDCRSILMGQVNNDKVLVSIFSAADIVVVPSLQENLSNVVLESLACGTPVIAFNIGGMPDMIQDGVNGTLVPPYDVDLMAEKIDIGLRKNYSREQVVATIQTKFNPDKIAKQYIDFYKTILHSSF